MEMDPIWLAIVQFIFTVGTLLVCGSWWLARLESEILNKAKGYMGDIKKEIDGALLSVETQIAHLNMWTRDTFVRREDFYPVVSGVQKSIEALSEKVDKRMTRIEDKIDNLAGRKNEHEK